MFDLPLVSPLDRVLFLRAQPHFIELDSSVLIVIANHTQEQNFRAGEALYEESDPRRMLHFLVEGTVRMTREGRTLYDVSAPGGVGMVQAMARTARPAGAFALTDVATLCIDIARYFQIMEDHFPLVNRLIENFGSSIAEAEAELGIAPGGENCVSCPEPASREKLDLVQRLTQVRRAPLFAHANLTMMTELLRDTAESYFEEGEFLFRADEEPKALHLILDGAVRVEDSGGTRVAYVGPGELVALGDFCRDAPRNYSAIAQTPVQLLFIDKTHYIDVLEDHFDHALDLLEQLARTHLELRQRIYARADAAMGLKEQKERADLAR